MREFCFVAVHVGVKAHMVILHSQKAQNAGTSSSKVPNILFGFTQELDFVDIITMSCTEFHENASSWDGQTYDSYFISALTL